MTNKNISLLILGIIAIFTSLYLFTRPAIYADWDFSNTGQIGDTIGGITAPIINLIGAFLVYISFQAQINANDIQSRALKDEKKTKAIDSTFNKYQTLLDQMNTRLNNLEFVVTTPGHNNSDGSYTPTTHIIYKGLNAINEYVLRVEKAPKVARYANESYTTYGIFLNFSYMYTGIVDLIQRIEKNIDEKEDKEYLIQNIKLFYQGFLQKFGDRIIKESSGESIENLAKLKDEIELKFGA